MKQTAVQWLEDKFQKFLSYYEGNHKAEPYTIQELSNDFEQAKAMEKEQIKDAWLSAWKDSMLDPLEDKYYEPEAEQYYNETYGTRR